MLKYRAMLIHSDGDENTSPDKKADDGQRRDLYEQIIHDYLKEKQPERYKELKAAGELNLHCEKMSIRAGREKVRLMTENGMRDYEANEIVIADLCQ